MKIYMHSQHTTCNICQHKATNAKKLTFHIKGIHKLSAEQYTAKYLTDNGQRPNCPECCAQTRYVSFTFKKFCVQHSNMGEAAGGKKGGATKRQWNKGETKNTNKTIATQAKNAEGAGNNFAGRKHTVETKKLMADKRKLTETEYIKRVSSRPDQFICLTPYNEYYDRAVQYLTFRCVICDTRIQHTLMNFERNPLCRTCTPLGSVAQHEIEDFVRSLGVDVVSGDRTVLNGKELDIYVPSRMFAIEYNGLYWHSEAASARDNLQGDENEKRKHFTKWKMCANNGVDLMQIYTDEWRERSDIVKSMIKHRLHMTKTALNARDLIMKHVSNVERDRFFDANHISGSTSAGVCCFGLYDDDLPVCMLSVRRPWAKHRYTDLAEIARFATAKNTIVRGGLSKLLKHVKTECIAQDFRGLMTYADLRFGAGRGYAAVGFMHSGLTGIGYDYTDGLKRYGRFAFRTTETMTEKQLADISNMVRVNNCGSNIYTMMFDGSTWSPSPRAKDDVVEQHANEDIDHEAI